MSLDEKTLNPLAPAELPGQNPDQPLKGKKRRKSERGASRKAKKFEDGGDSADDSAVLTMSDAVRKQPKKMLFEPEGDSGPVSLPQSFARTDGGSTRAALSATAAVMPVVPTPVAVAPVAPTPKVASSAPESMTTIPAESAPEEPALLAAAEPEPPLVADMKDSDVQAPLAMGEPDVDPAQGTFDLEPPTEVEAEQVAAAEPDMTETAIQTPAETASSETDSDPAETAVSVAAPEVPPASTEIVPPATAEVRPAPTPVRPVAVAAQPEAPEPAVETETPTRLSRSEMIARAARMSALSSARPSNGTSAAAASAPRPSAPAAPTPQQRPAELPRHAGDLYGYWTRVKNGRRFPSRADFDVEQMAENFPNSMLLTCGTNGGSHVNFSSILRLGANRRTLPGEALNFTSMITEWILAIGGEAARAGTPVQDTEVFPSPDGTFAYKIVALPLSDQQTRVDHVLCHLSRS